MRDGEYGLGIDVGDRTVAAAVCGDDATAAEPLPLPLPRVEDATLRGLVARTGTTTPVYVGDRPVAAADLLAAVVQRVRDAAAVHEGRPDAWTVVVVPPSWSGHRRAALARALERAGVPRFSLLSGAIAATAQHVAAGRLPARPTVAVYDLGASTLDLAVVGPAQDGSGDLDHLAGPPAPEPWGGRDADDAVVTLVRRCLSTPVDAHAAAALRAACVAAKEELSSCTSARLDVPGGSSVRITREELDELLLDRTRQSATAVATAAGAAGLAVGDLDAVVLTGGGVRVPLVAEVLSGELDRPLVVGPDPAMTAALGGARLAAEALRAQAPPDDPEAAPVLLTTGAPPRRHRRSGPPPRPSRRPGRSASVHRLRQSAVVAALFVLLAVAPAALAAVLGGNDTAALPGADVAAAQEAEASGAPTSAGPGGAPDGTGRSGSSGGDGPARTGGGSGRSDAVTSDGPAGVAGDGTTASEPGTTGGSAPSGATGPGTTAPGTTAVGTTAVGSPGGGRAASGTPAPGTTASGAAAADTGTGATAPTPPVAAGAGSGGTPAGPSTTTPPDPDPPAEPVVLPDPTPDPTPDPAPDPMPEPDPTPDPTPDPMPEPDPEVTPDAAPETTSEAPVAPAETP